MAPDLRTFPRTVGEAIRVTLGILIAGGRDEAVVRSEAEQLVQAALRKCGEGVPSRLELYLRGAETFPPEAGRELLEMASARAAGKTLQHLTGVQAFLEHEYRVGSEVLVPRPETEVLVLEAIRNLAEEQSGPRLGVEVGLGSGIISIELLARFKDLKMLASEVSPRAVALALRNAAAILGPELRRLEVVPVIDTGDVVDSLIARLAGQTADFLISNPPYLAEDPAKNEVESEVARQEPREALFAPAGDLMYFYNHMAEAFAVLVRPGGHGFFELPHERAGEIAAMFSGAGRQVRLQKDLTGRDRVLVVKNG